jgi:rubrerythrin
MSTKLMRELKKDEKKAPGQYHKLLKQMKTPQDRNLIRGIIRDEKKHFKKLNIIERRK